MIFLNQHSKFEELYRDFYWWGDANLSPLIVYESLRNGVFPIELRGSFAFVYTTDNDWWACVNHVAETPLFYTDSNKIFHNLSEWLKDITNPMKEQYYVHKVKNGVYELQRSMFGFCYAIGEHTPYDDILTVKPEHYVHNGVQHRYSDIAKPRGYAWDGDLYKELLDKNLKKIYDRRLGGYDQPINMLFSSGRDSAVIASALAQLGYHKHIDFYTITHKKGKHNEFADALFNAEMLDIAPVNINANIKPPAYDPPIHYEFNDSAWLVKYQTLNRHKIDGTIITGEVGNIISYGEAGKRLSYYVNKYNEWKVEEIASMMCSHVENFKTTTLNCSSFSDQFERDEVMAEMAWKRIVDDVKETLDRWGFWTSTDKQYQRNCLVNVGSLHHKVFRLRGYSTDSTRRYIHPLADYFVMEYTLGLDYSEREKHGCEKWLYRRAYEGKGPFARSAWNNQVRGLGIKCE